LKRIKKTGQLTVFNKAGIWAAAVDSAIATFNNLALGVKLVGEKEEKSANIVVVLANGPDQYKYYGDTAKTRSDFKPDGLHGQTTTLTDGKLNEIFFAVIFLPGKVKKATNKQKEVVVVHEFIHACGLDGGLPDGKKDPNQDHDSVGIMFGQMKEADDRLIEYLSEKGAQPMPPIRVGGRTFCKLQTIWANAEACKEK
jgi:predicted Zn-dependent protease